MDAARGPGSFADRLRRLRERAALSQEELAARAGLTAKAISALERGERRRPYPNTVRSLADALALDEPERTALATAARGNAAPPTGTPAPPTGTATSGSAPAVLPRPPTALFGRDDVRAELLALLRSGTTRLVTLTGVGGVGKTVLALAVAHDLTADLGPAAVAVVELAPVREASLVLPAVATALGVRQLDGPAVEGVAAAIGDARRLVVLDNVEHVLGAAPEVAELLARCPGLLVLATGRAPLRIRPERERPLGPLPLPSGDDPVTVAASAAAQVFLDRARAAGAEVALSDRVAADVAAICRRLDGLPLALELAAAHARYLPPHQLLERLDAAVGSARPRDLPERQRTIRATLDWSHGLLTDGEQVLLRRLSVFPGGCTLPALEQVAGADVLGPLGGLVEQSLVVADAGRFRLLEPVRQYAAARLAEAGETGDVADRAARVHLGLADEARAGLRGPDQGAWLRRVRAEHANLAAALARFVDTGDDGAAARLGADLWLGWALTGTAVEGLDRLARVSPDVLDARGRAALHVAVAGLRYASGDVAGMAAQAATAVAAARTAGEPDLLAEALVLAGSAALIVGGGDAELAEARAVATASGDAWAAAHAAAAHGRRLLQAGDVAGSADVLHAAEALARELANPFALATVLNAQATLALAGGDDDTAMDRLAESTALAAGIGTTWTLAYALPALAAIGARRGRPELAVVLFAAAAQAASVTVAYPPDSDVARTVLTGVRTQLGEDAFGRAWSRGRALAPGDVPAVVASLNDPGRPRAPS